MDERGAGGRAACIAYATDDQEVVAYGPELDGLCGEPGGDAGEQGDDACRRGPVDTPDAYLGAWTCGSAPTSSTGSTRSCRRGTSSTSGTPAPSHRPSPTPPSAAARRSLRPHGGAPGSEPEADPEDPSRPRTGRQRPQEPRRSAIHCPSTICAGEWTEVPK